MKITWLVLEPVPTVVVITPVTVPLSLIAAARSVASCASVSYAPLVVYLNVVDEFVPSEPPPNVPERAKPVSALVRLMPVACDPAASALMVTELALEVAVAPTAGKEVLQLAMAAASAVARSVVPPSITMYPVLAEVQPLLCAKPASEAVDTVMSVALFVANDTALVVELYIVTTLLDDVAVTFVMSALIAAARSLASVVVFEVWATAWSPLQPVVPKQNTLPVPTVTVLPAGRLRKDSDRGRTRLRRQRQRI